MYAVEVANSAAQVSTRLKTGRMPIVMRRRRTLASSMPSNVARRPIRKSLALQVPDAIALECSPAPAAATSASSRIRSSICARNHGSIRDSACTSRTASLRGTHPRHSGCAEDRACAALRACAADRLRTAAASRSDRGRRSGLQTAQGLLQRLLERATDRHHLADRLHLRRQTVVRTGEFLEREARHLGDDIVDGRFERRRSRPTRDVVLQLIERVTDRPASQRPWRSESRWLSTPAPRSATRADSFR